jgi:hypothetical protein
VERGEHVEAMNIRKWMTVPLSTFNTVERKIAVLFHVS